MESLALFEEIICVGLKNVKRFFHQRITHVIVFAYHVARAPQNGAGCLRCVVAKLGVKQSQQRITVFKRNRVRMRVLVGCERYRKPMHNAGIKIAFGFQAVIKWALSY